MADFKPYLLLICLCVFSISLYGQTEVEKDTTSKKKITINKPKLLEKDSLKFDSADKARIKSKLKNKLKENKYNKRKKPNLKLDSSKVSKLKLDSNRRDELKQKGKSELKNSGKSILAESKKDFPFVSSKPSPTIGGSLRIENYGTNLQNPLQLNEPMYSRFYFTPSVSLFGLPFTTDLYFTTEDNSLYNSNSISLSFDIWKFKDNVTKALQKELQEKQRIDKMRQFDIGKIDQQKERLQRQLDELKKDSAVLNHLKQKAQEEADKKLEEEKTKTNNRIQHLQDSMKNSAENSVNALEKSCNRFIGNHKRQLYGFTFRNGQCFHEENGKDSESG